MPLSDDDLLNNASPKTRQRFELARALRKNKEDRFKEDRFPVATGSLAQEQRQVWVRWEYSPEEWALFDAIDWRPIRLALFWLLISLPVSLPFWIIADFTSGSIVAVFVSVGLELLFLLFFWRALFVSETRKRHKARQSQSHRVTFSKEGLWEAGIYFPLDDSSAMSSTMVLKKVKMTSQPSVIHFHRTEDSWGPDGSSSSNPKLPLRVLVPRGHEEEAVHLVKLYQTEVIEARKQAEKQSVEKRRKKYNRPEPD